MKKLVTLSEFVDYTGCRGYAKKAADILLSDESGATNKIGYVKTENILDGNGNVVAFAVYPRFYVGGLWPAGTPYFFAGPRAFVDFLQKRVDQLEPETPLSVDGGDKAPAIEDISVEAAAALAAGSPADAGAFEQGNDAA